MYQRDLIWQLYLIEATKLAARHPELGIRPDALYLESPSCLEGILNRLKNHHDKVSSDGEE